MISKLSNRELEASLKQLVGGERKILYSILQHINEVESRRLYLEKAYSSLYEYLVKECHYSGSAAMRRISAARLLKEVPEISHKIQSGALNLSQIGELTRAVKQKENSGIAVSSLRKVEILDTISGKTTEQTQKEISTRLHLEFRKPETKFIQKDDSVSLSITLSQAQYRKLLDCKNSASHQLLSSKNGEVSLAAVLEFLMDQHLKIEKGPARAKKDIDGKLNTKNKTLTEKLRREVLKRDQCCQFKDKSSGKVCGSKFSLEVDHKHPQWAQGNHSAANLQVLCRAHNNFKYRQEANLSFV